MSIAPHPPTPPAANVISALAESGRPQSRQRTDERELLCGASALINAELFGNVPGGRKRLILGAFPCLDLDPIPRLKLAESGLNAGLLFKPKDGGDCSPSIRHLGPAGGRGGVTQEVEIHLYSS